MSSQRDENERNDNISELEEIHHREEIMPIFIEFRFVFRLTTMLMCYNTGTCKTMNRNQNSTISFDGRTRVLFEKYE